MSSQSFANSHAPVPFPKTYIVIEIPGACGLHQSQYAHMQGRTMNRCMPSTRNFFFSLAY